jgi:alpha-tubulin suppressor-like RCC1 family protein
VRLVAAGRFAACAAADSVSCWGDLGGGATGPAPIAGFASAPVELALGLFFACARTSTGGVLCWGGGDLGELGDGSGASSPSAVQVQGITSGAASIAASDNYACAVVGGSLWCWGSLPPHTGPGPPPFVATPVQISGITGATQVVSGSDHTCVLTATGEVDCFGDNEEGQLGDGTTTGRATPAPVPGLPPGVALAAGNQFTCAMTRAGDVYCWGSNSNGQLGRPATTDPTRPAAVAGLGRPADALMAGQFHMCARAAGRFACWGSDAFGALGTGTAGPDSVVPLVAPNLDGAIGWSAGDSFACAITATRTVQCWGKDDDEELGVPDASGPTPQQVPL